MKCLRNLAETASDYFLPKKYPTNSE